MTKSISLKYSSSQKIKKSISLYYNNWVVKTVSLSYGCTALVDWKMRLFYSSMPAQFYSNWAASIVEVP